ncbi:MAG TPA: PEGA domain-containing protein [Polyangia bacterium]
MLSLRARLVIVVSLAVALLLATAPATRAAGEETDAKAVARAKLVEGGELLKQGEYTTALARFQEAYDLVHSPKIQYDFGLAYMGLGRKADAIEAFEKFLNEAVDASPDLRANAERHRSTLAQQTGSLVVTSDVDGAEISVDGRSRGVTPLAAAIRLDPGPHQLVVEKQGTPPYAARVAVEAGRRVALEAKLASAAPPPVAVAAPVVPAPMPVVAAPPPPETELSPAERSRALMRKLAWGTGGVAVVALGLGVVERLVANGHYSDFNKRAAPSGACDADDRVLDHGGGDCSSLLSSGRSAATLSTVGLISGAVLAGASAVLFYESRKPAEGASTVGLACGPDLGRYGLLCDVAF